jgi:hypothetical protein
MSQICEELNEAVARPKNERERENDEEGGARVEKPEYWRKVNFPNAETGEDDYYEEVRDMIVPVDIPERDGSKVDFDDDGILKVLKSSITIHNHFCKTCKIAYSHEHKIRDNEEFHEQRDKQCPNKDCEDYHGGFNPTNSRSIFGDCRESVSEVEEDHSYDHLDFDSSDDEEMTYAETREYEKSMTSGLVRYIVSPRFCKHQQRNYIKCACMSGLKFEKDKYYFDEQTLNDLLAICYELRLRQFTKRPNFEVGEHYHKHFVTVISLTTMDKRLVCDPMISRDRFLTLVYELRGHYGMTHDFGQKTTLTGLDFEAQSIGDFVQRIIDAVKNAAGSTARTVKDMVSKIFEKIVESMRFAFSVISETIGKILDKLFKMIRRIIVKIIDPVTFITENMTMYGGLIVCVTVVALSIIIQLLGLFTMNLASRVIDTLIKWFRSKNDKGNDDDDDDGENVAEGPSDPIAGFLTLICLVMGLTYTDFTMISKRCREFTNLVAGGIAGSMLMGSLFLMLPIALQSALKTKFGTTEDKEKLMIEEWMIRANSVIRLKKIPKVLVSKEYRQWLTELITEAQGLRSKIKTPTTANVFVRILVNMMEILAMLENYDLEKSYRDYPFSLHIAAPAGYGKTLFVSKFMRDLFTTEERDVYTRPINDEFWSGFINQKIILFDEFLIGDHEDQSRHAKEYLEIVSTKVFKPPLASVDDAAVGIKGTRCEPLGVVSINNKPYSVVTNYDRQTLFRRRHHVLQLHIKPQFAQYLRDNTLKLSEMTDDAINNIDWLEFELLPCAPHVGQVGVKMNYTDMVAFLRIKYAEHRETCRRIREGLNNEVNEDLTPTQLLENAMRELRGIPNEPKGLTEALFDLLSDAKNGVVDFFKFDAEGPGTTTQTMDEGVRLKPRSDTKEFEIYKVLKNTKAGQNKSKEGIERRLTRARKLLDELVDTEDPNVTIDRKIVRGLYTKKVAAFEAEQAAFAGNSDSEQFTTADSDDEPVLRIQKDVVSDIAHTNVDPLRIHRHACLGMWTENAKDSAGNEMRNVVGIPVKRTFRCDKNFAHKHSDMELDHGFLCPTCITRGARESYVMLHGGPNFSGQKLTATNGDLLPDSYESCFMGEGEDFKKRMEDLWARIIVDKYLSFGYIPYVVFDTVEMTEEERHGMPEMYWEFDSKNKIKSSFMSMAKWVSIYVIIVAVWKLITMKKDAPDQLNFGAESPKANRESRNNRRGRKNFTKAEAQSGGSLSFEMNGKVHNAIPIKGQTFMTYYHSILNEDDKLIEPGTEMKIRWKGSSDTVKFDVSMTQSSIEDDLLFVTFTSKKIPQFPDITKKFWSLEDFESFEATSATINIDNSPKYVTVSKAKNKNYSYYKRKFEMTDCLMYRYPTMKGDCGSTVVSCGQHYPGKILGMHVAGGSRNGDSFGLAVIVTREDIEDALKIKVEGDCDADFSAEGPEILTEAPNLRKVVEVPMDEIIHVNRVSKIRKSAISEFLPWKPLKNKPIMSRSDSRANGIDPMVKALNIALEVNHDTTTIDEELLKSCAEATLENYKKKLVWPLGKRRLTFEEALQGVPGKLCSMKIRTSAGYPLCKVASKPGKRQFFEFGPNGELWYEPSFRLMCEEYVEKMENEGIDERRFIAYLKDELVSDSKIAKVKTRIIYAGDLISNVAYRMVFGSLLAAFNASFENTPCAVGMNQYSHDMHMIYDYLSEVGNKNFVAGDIDEWDKHQMRPVLKWGYWVWEQLGKELTTEIGLKSFYNQQNFSPAQFSDRLIYFLVTYFSGLFLTTIMNNITHENHIRYIFAKRNPTKVFEEHARAKVGGDDHVYNFSDEVAENMTPFQIRETFKELGHTYTSDSKDEELKDEFRKFEDITFLGAHPVLINGKYCGALKKKTLQEMIHWTRNRNKTMREECKMAMELASIWGEEYYTWFCDSVNKALFEVNVETIDMPVCSEMQRVVSGRTAASGEDFPFGFFAQGPPANSLAKLNEHKLVDGVRLNNHQADFMANKAVNETSMGVDFGTESRVFRGQFDWTTADIPGVPIFTIDLPFGLLSLGEPDNVQNMGFDRFVFWKGDIEISFQINATPFQQGLLVAYFVPLAAYPVELANITTCSHVKIQPDQSSTYTLTIPYLYLRSVMNTIARDTESLGTLYVTPLSALSAIDNHEVTLTVYSAFPGSKFTIPRPLDAEPGRNKFYTVTGLESIPEMVSFEGPFEAQGNVSSTSISNYWNAGGDMPIEGISNNAAAEAHQDLSADVKIPMPLDNPPLASGALPMVQHFSSMAASHGVRPTTDLQLKPATLARQQMDIFNTAETKFETLLAHQTLLTKFSVSRDTPVGTELYKITLNTRAGIAEGNNIPINIAILNQFMFWRCDVELTFVSVQTKFHSVRLQALMAYGAPGLVLGSRNVNYSSNMNFAPNDECTNYVHTEIIPFNAQTEFLRTYEGESVTDPIQNYALGTFGVYVLNSLIAPDTVSGSVEILVFLRFLNPKLAVPRPNSPFTWNNYLEYTPSATYGWRGRELLNDAFIYRGFTRNVLGYPTINMSVFEILWTGIGAPDGDYTVIGNRTFTGTWVGPTGQTSTWEVVVDQITISSGTLTLNRFTPNLTFTPTNASWVDTPDFYFMIPVVLMDFEAQGPPETDTIEDVNPSGTGENTDQAEKTIMTMEETPVRSNIPCKWEIGEKFEFTISDIHEIGRRYIRVIPISNALLDQFAVLTRTTSDGIVMNHLNIPVQPQNMWRGLFASWAGSVKFRIFRNGEGFLPQVFFVPYYNRDVAIPGLPIIDAMSGFDFVAYSNAYTSSSSITGPLAREVLYPISETNYIDVSAPFQSHYNFCYNSKTQVIAPISSGTLTLSYGSTAVPTIFTSFGDDLRLGIYRPPAVTTFNMTVFRNGIGGFSNPT